MDILNYIRAEFIIVVVALWVIGTFLKKSPIAKDWIIPYILVCMGIALTAGLQMKFNADIVIQGILCAGVAVLGHQIKKQTINKSNIK